MTQEELKKQFRGSKMFQSATDEVTSKQFEQEILSEILQLINRHVADVIGEDEKEKDVRRGNIWTNLDSPIRNELRAEQRKRGGL